MPIEPVPVIIALVIAGLILVILADFGALSWLRVSAATAAALISAQ